MSMRMLIDARHPEETRVAVVKGNRIEEFDFEAAAKKQLKGNIYLAKVTRVEPSLQAAFVEYGGNRHGFLAFSEIHPDYYQIPKEDREALLREERELHRREQEQDEASERYHAPARRQNEEDSQQTASPTDGEEFAHSAQADNMAAEIAPVPLLSQEPLDDDQEDSYVLDTDSDEEDSAPEARAEIEEVHDEAPVQIEEHGGHEDSASEDLRHRRMNLRRRYKIQEVIRRRQVMLVQVVKEERGNKGAALTTYLSLAGRYSVLMPNSSHGGGISRKISSAADRKRLKEIISDLGLPAGMGCIVRTAGLKRTKTEIRRDFDYLTRLWDEIREATMASTAPALIYEDSDLIKRAIRDIYSRDIDEVLIEGEEGYRSAKNFMKLLMPSHAKKVKLYVDPIPLFQRHQVEAQLASMYHPVVQLKSGGYIVINPTEALVSIDINSGRSTREHNIEETAVKTNMEAAEEIARQLRLRDMAGLVVIDFIDMEHGSNVRKVERCMKEALKNDRARIQVGRISSFGLMEMSRQRLRTGVLEASTHTCPMCDGAGIVRSVPSAALAALRGLEAEAIRGRASQFCLRAGLDVAVYILNRKRDELVDLENRYGISIEVVPDSDLIVPNFAIDSAGPAPTVRPIAAVSAPMIIEEDDDDLIEDEDEEEDEEETRADSEHRHREERGDSERRRGRRRRSRRRGRREDGTREDGTREGDEHFEAQGEGDSEEDGAQEEHAPLEGQAAAAEGEQSERRGRRRGRRGGRRRGGGDRETRDAQPPEDNLSVASADDVPHDFIAPLAAALAEDGAQDDGAEALMPTATGIAVEAPEAPAAEPRRRRRKEDGDAPAPRRGRPRRKAADAPETGDVVADSQAAAVADAPAVAVVAAPVPAPAAEPAPAPAPAPAPEPAQEAAPAAPTRTGWWQRTFGE